MKLVIPTLNRIGMGQQRTLNQVIPKKFWKDTYLCCPPEEVEAHAEYWTRERIIAPNVKGIANVREAIMNGGFFTDPKIIMLDDDCTSAYRTHPDGILGDGNGLKGIKTEEELNTKGVEMFESMDRILDTYAHAGWSESFLNRSTPEKDHMLNFKVLRFLAYNKDLFPSTPIVHNRVTLREDYDVTLQLLRAGKPNYIDYRFAQTQPISNAPGGCSTYRDAELQTKTAHDLVALHPGYVKYIEKAPASGWFGGVTFGDVNVQWKKAYKSSDAYKKSLADGNPLPVKFLDEVTANEPN